MSKSNRPIDLLVWGATGFTGCLISEHLARHAPEGFKWAIGGRSRERLESVKSKLVSIDKNCESVQIIIGDTTNQQSVDNAMKQTRVVINAAGPYLKYGTPVVDACVRLGTDYCDLTGESNWIKQIIDKYHEQAKKNGVMIVPSCGFDSVPSDLGALMMAEYAKNKLGVEAKNIRCIILASGGVSGGTVHSAMEAIETSNSSELKNPYLLNPSDRIPDRKAPGPTVKYDADLKLYSFPFLLSFGNMLMVRRTQALQNFKNGKYTYAEGAGTKSALIAYVATFATLIAMVLLKIGFFRNLLKKFVPAGSGPSKKTMDEGHFTLKFVSEQEGPKPRFFGKVSAIGDPGYSVTSKMIAESGLCLALNREELPTKEGGIHTSGSSMGSVLIERLKNIGIEFSVTEEEK